MKTKEKALGVTAMTRQGEKKDDAAISNSFVPVRFRFSKWLDSRVIPWLLAFARDSALNGPGGLNGPYDSRASAFVDRYDEMIRIHGGKP